MREGGQVRTLNRYVGRAGEAEGSLSGKLAGLDSSVTTTKSLTKKERETWSGFEPWVRARLSNDEGSSDEEMIADFVTDGNMSRIDAKKWVSKRGFFLGNIVFDDGSVYDPHRRSLFSSPSDFGHAMVEQIDPPKWGEDARDQLLGGRGRTARRSAGVGGKRKAAPFDFEKPVAFDPAGKRRFHAQARAKLRAVAKELGLVRGEYTLRTLPGGIAVCGETRLQSDNLIVQVSQYVMGGRPGILYRSCEGRSDFRGGLSYFEPLSLLNTPGKLAEHIKKAGLVKGRVESPVEKARFPAPQRQAGEDSSPSFRPPVSAGMSGGGSENGQAPAGAHVRRDIQEEITDTIIEAIESGRDTGTFQMPWRAIASEGFPVNAVTKQGYHGVNVLVLSYEAMQRGWPNKWASFQQWRQKGASVRKGEHGVPIVFYSTMQIQEIEEDEEGNDKIVVKSIPVFRYSTVFNVAQVDNAPEGAAPASPPVVDPVNRSEAVEKFVTRTQADIRYGGNRAFFSPGSDFIQIPPREAFTGTKTSSPTEAFYSTILHELCHWTGGEKRLNRENHNRFGDELYAKEELVAEIGAAFACGKLHITPELRDDHIQYVSSWLKILKEDKRAIIHAASLAGRAVEYLESLQGQGT